MSATHSVTTSSTTAPTYDGDFWSDEVLADPYPTYKQLREAGPAVWLSRHDAWALTTHAAVREGLRLGEVFSSARGCTMNGPMNEASAGVMLSSDDPFHRELRQVFSRPLTPGALAALKPHLLDVSETLVETLVSKRSFDAVSELAHYLPLTVVTELVGLGEEGKSKMLAWAVGIFNAFGPINNARTLSGIEIAAQAFAYLGSMDKDTLSPGSWGMALFEAADRGELSLASAKAMLMDYLGPALDTTINATSSAIWLFARNPEQWDKLRANPILIPDAIDEVLRLESPIRAFSRYVTRDHKIGNVTIAAGSRALVLYASGNRDEQKYQDADRFDIQRKPRDHLAFGHGTHTCAGMHLAKMEVTVLLEALIKRVKRFHISEERRELHNTLRGLAKLVVDVEPLDTGSDVSPGLVSAA